MSLLWIMVMCFPLLWLKYAGAIDAEDYVFTINSVQLKALPSDEAKRGAQINLTCSVDISQNAAFEIQNQYFFYKDDNLVYNMTSVQKTALHSITAARVSHSGYYKCKVHSNGKDRSSQELLITVSGLAPPNITISREQAKEGDSVDVFCEVPDEKPPFEFTFIKTNQNQNQQHLVRKALNQNYFNAAFQVAEGDSILYFQCSATIQSVPKSETSNLSEKKIIAVTAPFSTPTLRVRPPGNITEGNNITVECNVRTHRLSDDIQVTMQKDKKIVGSSKEGRIVLNMVAAVAHMGNYTCKAESEKVSKSSSLYIHVAELFPRPLLVTRETHISENSTLALSCFISGHNQTLLNFIIEKDNYLRIQMRKYGKYSKTATEADSGSYVCLVTIQNITKWSRPLQIFVYAPVSIPELTLDTRRGSDVVVGQMFTLKCKSSRGTPPIQYRVYQGNKTLGWTNVTENALAEFHVLALASNGCVEYRCEAKNKNRADWKSSTILSISVIVPVEEASLLIVPENGEVEAGQELSLVCKVQFGSLPIIFTFYQRDPENPNQNRPLNQTVAHKISAEWIYTDSKKSKEGQYFCTATNRANVSTTSRQVSVKVVLAAWKTILIASSAIAVCIAVIAGVTWWYLHKKKKDRTLELSRITNSNNTKFSSIANTAEDPYYGHNENGENHVEKSAEEKEVLLPGPNPTTNDVAYVEVMQETPDPHKAPPPRGTDTVYSEIRRSLHDAELNNTIRIEGSPDAT